jgi:tryptophan-rich sensory protein
MQRYNHFLYGFVPGLLLPVAFMWLYLSRLYPSYVTFAETISNLYPSILLGKLFLLSIMPNLGFVFVFYKSDSFKIAAGILLAAMPYMIACILML